MGSTRFCQSVFVAACVLFPSVTAAQGLTGAFFGTVKDEQDAVLVGAVVRVTSPALIGGPITVTTNERGHWRFPALPPGTYVVDVERPGFTTYREDGVVIGAGASLERTVILSIAGVAESLVVEGAGSRMEARGSGVETRFRFEDLRTIPTRRFSMFDFIREAPGMSGTSMSGGQDASANAAAAPGSVSSFGSGTNENLFLIDGTNFTCPCSGGAAAEPGVDFIQEIQIQSVGASVEHGNIQGAVINVVTRQGGDRFMFDASYYGQPARFTSQPVLLPMPRGSQPTSGYVRGQYRDFTSNLGGPLVRDRLWFFTGYQYLRDSDSQPGTDPRFPRVYEQDKLFAKLTWRLSPSLQLMQSVHQEFWSNPDRPTLVTPFEATAQHRASVPSITFGHVMHTLSDRTLWEARAGRFVSLRDDEPSTGDGAVANRLDRATGISSGAPAQIGGTDLFRTTAKAMLTHYQSTSVADHQWKGGMQLEIAEHTQAQVIPTGVRFIDNAGLPFQAVSRVPAVNGGKAITLSAFASDAVTIGNRITVSAGVRLDHSRAISQDVHAPGTDGRETSAIIGGIGTLYTWNIVSPRLGVTARLSQDGRTMLRSSYGRFYQGVLTGELAPVHPGMTPTMTTAFNAATNAYTTTVSVVDPRINLRLDLETRAPRTDEYSVGVDRELTRQLSIALAYVHKRGNHFVGWSDTAGQYSQETRTLADGRVLPVSVLTGPTADRRFLLTNPDGYFMRYDGLVVALEKRRASGWHLFGTYTYSRARGLHAASLATAAGAQISSPLIVGTFGRDPNDLTNADGRLPNDRPHALRLMGSVEVPRTGLALAANLHAASGKPWAATAQVTLPQGDQRILLERRGSRRLSSQTLVDMRLSRPITFGSTRIELLVDVLNVLNNDAAEALGSDNFFASTFGQPSVFVDPRRVMASVRLNLGR
jgi:hypothetical protein